MEALFNNAEEDLRCVRFDEMSQMNYIAIYLSDIVYVKKQILDTNVSFVRNLTTFQ